MSVSGKVSDTLIDSEFSYKPASETQPGPWSEVAGTKSWHTGTQTAPSTRSTITTGYGRPSTRSVSGSAHSFDSSIAERSQSASDQVVMRNGFAKVKAYVCIPQWLSILMQAELTSNRSLRPSYSKMTTSQAMRTRPRTTTRRATVMAIFRRGEVQGSGQRRDTQDIYEVSGLGKAKLDFFHIRLVHVM